MRHVWMGTAALSLGLLLATPARAQVDSAGAGVQPSDGNNDQAGHAGLCDLATIAQGEHSGWGANDPGFLGADLVIRDRWAWLGFWRKHTGSSDGRPLINFEEQVVIVAVQGHQNSGGGPNISIVGIETEDFTRRIVVVDDERPGPLDILTNPFHIVAVNRTCLSAVQSLAFVHVAPRHATGVVAGRVFAETPDGHEVPLPGALVTLRRNNTDEPLRTVSGHDGSYFFVNVDPGGHVGTARHPGFEPASAPIAVQPGERTIQDFILHHRGDDDRTGAFGGRVLGHTPDGHAMPIADALVRLLNDDGEVARTRTDDRGEFLIEQVAPGEYGAVARAPGWRPEDARVEIVAGEVTEEVFILRPARAPTPAPGP